MSMLVTVALRREEDVVLARQRARDVAQLLGFDAQEQTRFSTAVSEIARNAHRYGTDGRVELCVSDNHLVARVTDAGLASLSGLADLRRGPLRSPRARAALRRDPCRARLCAGGPARLRHGRARRPQRAAARAPH